MPEANVLLISDDETLIASVQSVVQQVSQCRMWTVSPGNEPISFVEASDVALVIAHIPDQGDPNGIISLPEQIAKRNRSLPTLVVSNGHDDKVAIKALRSGAAEWLNRPLDLNRLAYLVDSLTLRARHCADSQRAQSMVSDDRRPAADSWDLFGCCNEATTTVAERLRRVAAGEITVLLKGETGVGKTRMARMIHEMSPRRSEPLLVVNCAALPENLLESELFGHVKGAFTGADNERIGKFAAAGKGTLLLDEVDSLPLVSQAKLLRVVDERAFEQLGSNKTTQCHARLIVATNRNLETEVAEGRFREDLMYRLNVISFQLFPLRQRPAAIATLVERFIGEFSDRSQMPRPHVSSEAMAVMQQYPWPGNVRELRNAMERAVALCVDEIIRVSDLPENLVDSTASSIYEVVELRLDDKQRGGVRGSHLNSERPLSEAELTDSAVRRLNPAFNDLAVARAQGEIRRICEVLDRFEQNRTKAAEHLGISRTALYNKLNRFGLIVRPR